MTIKNQKNKIFLANPRGFCAGVDRAISIVEKALDIIGPPIYVRHEVVHNKFVVNGLREKGAVFVEELTEIPDGATVIFSAHGVSQAVKNKANERNLTVFDATCPLVTKVHMEVARCSKLEIEVILIGHTGHPEVEGTMGQYNNKQAGIYLVENTDDICRLSIKNPAKLYYVTQTTLSVDDSKSIIDTLKIKFPKIEGPKQDDICYATQNRQDAVRELAEKTDLVIVVGSVNSSNSNRLSELAKNKGIKSYLVDNASEIDVNWLVDISHVGVTAGASAPEILVQEVMDKLIDLGDFKVEHLKGVEETIHFALPKELRK